MRCLPQSLPHRRIRWLVRRRPNTKASHHRTSVGFQSVTEVHENAALGENFLDRLIKASNTQHTDSPVTCGLYRRCRRSECASASGWRLLEECCCSPLDVLQFSQTLQRGIEIERDKGGDLQREKLISPEWRQAVDGDLGVF